MCSTSDPYCVFIPVTTFNVTDYKIGKYSPLKPLGHLRPNFGGMVGG
jgi:hypothetical protein